MRKPRKHHTAVKRVAILGGHLLERVPVSFVSHITGRFSPSSIQSRALV